MSKPTRKQYSLRIMGSPDLSKGAEQWVACLPVGTLMALPTDKGEQSFEVTAQYLHRAAAELERYYADLRARGSNYLRPIIVQHDDKRFAAALEEGPGTAEGRRSGDILKAAVRPYNPATGMADGPETLFLKVRWRDEAWQAIQDGYLEHTSITILTNWTDKQSGITYAPFIFELSETTTPVVAEFDLSQTLDPAVLAEIGLVLADVGEPTNMEQKMGAEEIQQLVAQILDERLAEMAARFDELEAMVMEIAAAGEGEDGEDGEEIEGGDDEMIELADEDGAAAQQQQPADLTAVITAAVQSAMQPMQVELSDLKSKVTKTRILASRAARGLNTGDGQSGEPPKIAASDKRPKGLSIDEAWTQARSELITELSRKPTTREIKDRAKALRGQ